MQTVGTPHKQPHTHVFPVKKDLGESTARWHSSKVTRGAEHLSLKQSAHWNHFLLQQHSALLLLFLLLTLPSPHCQDFHKDKHNINQFSAFKWLLSENHSFRPEAGMWVSECVCVRALSSVLCLGWNSRLWLEGKPSCSKLDFMLGPSQQQYATLRQSHLPPAVTPKLALCFFKG